MPFKRTARTFSRCLTAPKSLTWMVFGKTLAGFFLGVAVSVGSLLVGVIGYGTSASSPALLVLSLLACGMCFSCLGILAGSMPSEAPGNFMTVLNFVCPPLLLMSVIFMPPGGDARLWARGLVAISPLSYAHDLLRRSTGLAAFLSWWLDLPVLLLYAATCFSLAAWILNPSRLRA
ncbi:MAG: ABC transporter permease [Actinobacteria bacterium]|nr:ABC transporter permease [Actinomycetota bacterium]